MSDTSGVDDDTHEPALGAGSGTTDDDGGDDDAPVGAVAGTPTEDFDPIYRRVIHDSTRSLFKAMPKVKPEDLDDDMDVAIGNETPAAPPVVPVAAVPVVAPPAPAVAAAPVVPVAVTPAPPPVTLPIAPLPVVDDRATMEFEIREKAIADREAAFAGQVKALEDERKEIAERAVAEFRLNQATQYLEKGGEVFIDWIKEFASLTTEDEIRDEAGIVIGELSNRALKIPVEQEILARGSQRRALGKVSAHNVRLEKQTKELEARLAREKAADEARRADEAKKATETRQAEEKKHALMQAHRGLTDALRGADSNGIAFAALYPHLMAEQDPASEILRTMDLLFKHQPDVQHTWASAAGIAETHFKTRHEDDFKRLTPLFTPAAPAAPATPAVVPQGAPQGKGARTTTLTTGSTAPMAPAMPRTPSPQPAEDVPYDAQAARRRSLAGLAASLQKRDAQA
jgi:hypothetical protein